MAPSETATMLKRLPVRLRWRTASAIASMS
jgi:hypothetical protein